MTSIPVSVAGSGDNTAIVADPQGRAIVVRGLLLVAAGAVTLSIGSGLGGSFTALTGVMSLVTGVPLALTPPSSLDTPALFKTKRGDALNLKLGGAVQVSGFLLVDLE